MKLNHVNLTVTDVLMAYVDLEDGGGNAGMMFLSDGDGMVLTLLKAGTSVTVAYPGPFHIGFFIDSDEKVDAINRRPKADGRDVAPPERHHAYGV